MHNFQKISDLVRSRVLFYANSTYGFQNDLYDLSTACYVVGPNATEAPPQTTPFIVSNTTGASGGGAMELRNYAVPSSSQPNSYFYD